MDLINLIQTEDVDLSITLKLSDLHEVVRSMVAEVLEASEKKNDDDIIWLSPETVCERLGVTRPTLWRWEKENYLTPTRFGRRTRYRLSDVERIKGAERK